MTNPNDPVHAFEYNGKDFYGDPARMVESGLSKREYFSAMAMQAILTKGGYLACESPSEKAVFHADNLIKALNKTK